MGRLEEQLLKSVALRPFSWLRFIDDIDMKWSHGREALTAFLDEANNFHPSIKFTAEISPEQHVFLDTKSSLVGDICWSVYKTDRYTPVSPTHKLSPETLLQKYSLQPCTSPQTYLLWFGHLWIKSKRTDWPPLQTGLSEIGNFTCHWESTATKERRLTFLQA